MNNSGVKIFLRDLLRRLLEEENLECSPLGEPYRNPSWNLWEKNFLRYL